MVCTEETDQLPPDFQGRRTPNSPNPAPLRPRQSMIEHQRICFRPWARVEAMGLHLKHGPEGSNTFFLFRDRRFRVHFDK